MHLREFFNHYMAEKAVTSDLTIGFEVECIVPMASMPSVEKLAKSINAEIVDDSSMKARPA